MAHGSPRGISNDKNDNSILISTAEELNTFLEEKSEVWKNRKEGDNVTIVLHSCRTGRDIVNDKGEKIQDSFARKVSKTLDATIIAPDERVAFTRSGEQGPRQANKQDKNGAYTSQDKSISSKKGNWIVYRKGEVINKFQENPQNRKK